MAAIFDGGPHTTLLRKLRLIRPNDPLVRRRALFVIGFTWLPLAVLAAGQQVFAGDGTLWFFLRDAGVHARFLVAAPLLVISDSWCLARLSRCASYLCSSGIVRTEDRTVFEAYLASTRRGLNSKWAEILGFVLAYGFVLLFVRDAFRLAELPQWHAEWRDGVAVYSAAGYWHLLISVPLLVLQLFSWVWRHVMWWRLLRLTSRLPLRLIAAHPDGSGGLRLLSTVLRAYWPLCFALGVIVAGRTANQMQAGASLYDFRFAVIGLPLFLVVFTLMPFTVFVPILIRLSGEGALSYDSLANAIGERLETKWLNSPERLRASALEAPDFSATTDLYSVVANVQQIGIFPVRMRAVYELIVVTLLPFIPVVLAYLPLDTILMSLGKFLV
jgi:hypothetical protein